MAKQAGFTIEEAHELSSKFLLRDTRRANKKVADWLKEPENLANLTLGGLVLLLFVPLLIPLVMPGAVGLFLWQRSNYKKIRLPMRFPTWSRAMDPSGLDDNQGGKEGLVKAQGIAFIGNQRPGMTIKGGTELWASDSDVRVHKLIMAATGGGKTNTLVSWLVNDLSFGSGATYVDGKAQNDVYIKIWSVCWLMWREDDVLLINYMTDGSDEFAAMNAKATGKRRRRMSNSFNPFSFASSDTINNLLQTLNAKASGDGAMWQAKANNMTAGVVKAACYLRSRSEIQVSAKTLRYYMVLPNMIDMWNRKDIPESAIAPLNAYLTVGLPGFNQKAAKEGKPQGQQTMDQHGFLSGQFAPVLGMLADVYDYIFSDVTPEVDMTDCVYNNRILVVLIPSLLKSENEAASLGKIVVAAAKMMMGANLGSMVEGEINEIMNNRPTNSDEPYEIILDELGYYFAPGIDLMFAQARSLMIGLTASGQDFQAMAKGDNKNAVESMIANTRMKFALTMEDPKETFEIFSKSGGEAYVARVSRFERSDGMMGKSAHMKGADEASIEKQSRVSLEELRGLGPGDGIILYKERVIRASLYNIFSDFREDAAMQLRLNTMLPIKPPVIDDYQQYAQERSEVPVAVRISSTLMTGAAPRYVATRSVRHEQIIQSAAGMASLLTDLDPSTPPATRGIAMFQAVVNELRRTEEAPELKAAPLEPEEARPVRQVARDELRHAESRPELATRARQQPAPERFDDPLSFLDEPPIVLNEPSNEDGEVVFGAARTVRLSNEAKQKLESISEMLNPEVVPSAVSGDIESMMDNAVDYTMLAFAEQATLSEGADSMMDTDAIVREFAALEQLVGQRKE